MRAAVLFWLGVVGCSDASTTCTVFDNFDGSDTSYAACGDGGQLVYTGTGAATRADGFLTVGTNHGPSDLGDSSSAWCAWSIPSNPDGFMVARPETSLAEDCGAFLKVPVPSNGQVLTLSLCAIGVSWWHVRSLNSGSPQVESSIDGHMWTAATDASLDMEQPKQYMTVSLGVQTPVQPRQALFDALWVCR